MNDFLVYSPLNGVSALINRLGLIELKKQMKYLAEDTMYKNDSFYDLAKTLYNSPARNVTRKTGRLNPDFLGIIPSRNCNGACNYCDFGAELNLEKVMDYKQVVHIIDWYINYMLELKKKEVEIHFFGGEPMITLDVVEVTVHRTRMLAAEKRMFPVFAITTNGQYKQEKAKWIGNYFNSVVLSFDGFEDIQNFHRPLKDGMNSFEKPYKTAKIISDSNAELNIRCCISQANIKMMEELTHFFCKSFRVANLNFEILCQSEKTTSWGLYPPDPIDFAIHFKRSRDIAKKYGVDVVYASDISSCPQATSCPVGTDVAIFSPDGRVSNCYLLQEKWQEVGLDLDFGILSDLPEQTIIDKSLFYKVKIEE